MTEQTITTSIEQASQCFVTFSRIAKEIGGLELTCAKLSAISRGEPTEPLNQREAVLASHAIGALVHLHIAWAVDVADAKANDKPPLGECVHGKG